MSAPLSAAANMFDTVPVADVDEEELATKMVGHAVQLVVEKTPAKPGDVVFEIDNLTVKDERKLDAVKKPVAESPKGRNCRHSWNRRKRTERACRGDYKPYESGERYH